MVVHAYSPSYSGGWSRRITWTQEVEVAVSQDHTTALQRGDRAILCLQKLKIKKKKTSKKCTWQVTVTGDRIPWRLKPYHMQLKVQCSTVMPTLTFGEHACYVDASEGGHIGKVRFSACRSVEMSVQRLGIDNASIIWGKDCAKPSVWNKQTNKNTKSRVEPKRKTIV